MIKITVEDNGKIVETMEGDIFVGTISKRAAENRAETKIMLAGSSSPADIANIIGIMAGQVIGSISQGNAASTADLYARMDTRALKILTGRDKEIRVDRVEDKINNTVREGSIDAIAADIGKDIAEAIREVLTPGGGGSAPGGMKENKEGE